MAGLLGGSRIGGLLGDFGSAMNTARTDSPELLQAVAQQFLTVDPRYRAQAWSDAATNRQQRLVGDRAYGEGVRQFDARMAQDQSQFDRRLAQDQSQFAASHALDRSRTGLGWAEFRDAQGRRKALSSQTARFMEAQGAPAELVDLAESGGGAEAYDMWRGMSKRPDAPSGYRYAGDGVSLQPIPGGPADKANAGPELPAEVGARIGLGDAYLEDYTRSDPKNPGIRQRIEGGDVDSWTGRASLALGAGEGGEIWRRVESGRDALIRNLTGAGMSMAEAENQAARYQITATDSKATMLDKLDGLQRDLEATRSGAIRAKSGTLSRDPPGTRRAEAPGSTSGRTSSGLSWSLD